jgi:hypothetical protein
MRPWTLTLAAPLLIARSLAAASQQPSGPPPQSGGVLVSLPRQITVAEMTDSEILSGELGGEVTAITGTGVAIALRSSPCVPRVGDRVELFSVNKGFASEAGEWRVTYAEGDDVRAAAVEAKEKPVKGMTAIVHSAIPAGALSHIGFENTPRPQLPVQEMMQWADRHLNLVKRAQQSFEDGERYRAASLPDRERAAQSYGQAAVLNHVQAARALYQMLLREDGPPHAGEAAKWLRRAAELGDVEAQYRMGEANEGRLNLLPADTAKARAWYRKAVAQGSAKAKTRLQQIGK